MTTSPSAQLERPELCLHALHVCPHGAEEIFCAIPKGHAGPHTFESNDGGKPTVVLWFDPNQIETKWRVRIAV